MLNDPSFRDIIKALLAFTINGSYLSNPYLIAKLVEVMFVINPAVQRNTDKLNDMLLNHDLALNHLVPALMNFYVGQ